MKKDKPKPEGRANIRKKVDEELQKQNRQQEAILNTIPDIAWLKDTESRFIAVNEPFAKACGVNRKEIVGKNDLDIWPQDLAERYRADDKEVMATGRQKQVEEPLEITTGEKTWIETIKTPIYNNEGEVIGTTGIARDITIRKLMEENLREAHDELEKRVQERTAELEESNKELHAEITERKKVEETLKDSERRVREIIDNAPFGAHIYELYPDDRLIFTGANRSADRILGVDHKKFINKTIEEAFPQLVKTEIPTAYRHVAKSGEHYETESIDYNENKIIGGFEVSAFQISANRMAAFFRDITERKKAEKLRIENERLEAADKAKSEFLANMSHELRTPLNSSIGFSELLKQGMAGELSEKQKHYVDNILTSNQFLLTLINDILDISKIEAGKIELVPDKMSVPLTIKETLSLIKEKAMMHNLLLKTEFDPELDFIEADKQRFKQILFNLLSNAIKFSKEEGGTITITAKKEGAMANISVSDTGIGIKEESIVKLFHKFEQLESGIGQKYGGTGLGLAITKQLVELHGGRIWAQSRYGEGSTFTFTIPLNAKNEEK
ncbi:MAG: ATP-binding protein [Candidatus Methanoperedens sp.]